MLHRDIKLFLGAKYRQTIAKAEDQTKLALEIIVIGALMR